MSNWKRISSFDKENRGIYFDDKLIWPFASEEEVKSYHTIYIYANEYEGNLYLKVGKCKESIYKRYHSQDVDQPWLNAVGLFLTNLGDEEIHKYLQSINGINYEHIKTNNTDENYLIKNPAGIKELINDVQKKINKSNLIIEDTNTYSDIIDVVCETYEKVESSENKNTILYLPTRWGKTRTSLEICNIFNNECQISIMISYIGTVRNSYFKEINFTKRYNDNFRFYDLSEVSENDYYDIIEFLENPNNHVMFYLSITGDKTNYEKRTEFLKKFKKYKKLVFIEECDFGAWCDNKKIEFSQINKVKETIRNNNIYHTFFTSGTGFEKITEAINKITKKEGEYNLIQRNYINDILKVNR